MALTLYGELWLLLLRWHGRDRTKRKRYRMARHRLRAGSDELADGNTITVDGIVRGIGESIDAPLSGEACIGHRTCADVWRVDGERRKRFLADIERTELCRFVLETTRGSLLVTADTAVIDLPPGAVVPQRRDLEAAFVADTPHAGRNTAGADFRHALLVEGDRVAVSGVVVLRQEIEPGREYGYRDAPLVARITGHERWPLTIGKARR